MAAAVGYEMKTLVALFRGINVGGRNKLPMKELASLMEGTGLEDVRTYIQSGNVVFRAADAKISSLADEVPEAIEERFGFRPELTILSENAIDEAISANPYPEADSAPSTVHLTFLSEVATDPRLEDLEAVRVPSERFELKEQVFYLHAPDGIGRSKLAARIERLLGVSGTSRNWRTVRKLEEMVKERS